MIKEIKNFISSRPRIITIVMIWGMFFTLTFLIVMNMGGIGNGRLAKAFFASLLTITGPMAGGIMRGFQSCCVLFGLKILPFSSGILGLGIIVQFIPLPFQRYSRALRMTFWIIGWIAWFLGALISYGHALS